MSDDPSAQEIVDRGAEGVDDRGVPGYAQAAFIGGTISAGALSMVEIITGIPSTLMAPIIAFAEGMATFIGGTLGAPVRITDAGAAASAGSFLEGTGALFGPFAFPVAVAVSAAGLFVFLMFLRRISTNPLQILTERRG